MKSHRPQVEDTDAYIARFPADVRAKLAHIRATVRRAAPGATEAIKYGLPTFVLGGKNLVHYGAFAGHLSFFPTSSPIRHFQTELEPFTTSRGTVRLPLDRPPPLGLIRRMVRFRVKEVQAALKAKPRAGDKNRRGKNRTE